MDAYTGFAAVYDELMDNIPYEEWGKYLIDLLNEYGIKDGIVLDLGCGTGNITEILANNGYDMIGVDNSQEMLNIAMEKRGDDTSILYLLSISDILIDLSIYIVTTSSICVSVKCFNFSLISISYILSVKMVNNNLAA